MFDAYQEHLAHSAPCSSRWDGFDRGDTGWDEEPDHEAEQAEIDATYAADPGLFVRDACWLDHIKNFVGPFPEIDEDLPF